MQRSLELPSAGHKWLFVRCLGLIVCLYTSGCGGGGGGSPPTSTSTTTSYSISGTVTGLVGTGLILQNNGDNNLAVSTNGAFAFSTRLASASTYNVTILAQPTSPAQTCVVTNGVGTVPAGSVLVSCTTTANTATYGVGGTISNLSGSGLILQNNGGDNLAISSSGAFAFPTALANNSSYNVTVAVQPTSPAQTCVVMNGIGTIGETQVANVIVNCSATENSATYTVGGTVSGLVGSGLVLQNNDADDISVSANGGFSFTTALANAATYNVTVASAPSNPSQVCTAANATGTIAGANVISVSVSCTPPSATLSFSPARLLAVYDDGDNRTLQVTVIPSTALTAVAAARVVDTVGVFESAFQLYKNVDNSYTANLQTKNTLAAGAYVGNLTIELCQDVNCTVQHPGSPALLPYDVRVVSISPNLKSLSPMPGGTDWAMHASNPAHDGFVPVTIDPAQFSRRWQWRPQDPKIKNLSDVVTSQGRAILSTNAGFMGIAPGGGYSVIAIDETGGSTLWTYPITLFTGAMNPPSVVNDKVYAVAGNNPSSTLYALDVTNANLIWSASFATQWDYYDTPTVMNGIVVNHAGFNSGGIAAFDIITGSMKWINDCPVSICDFTHSGAVAMDAVNAYAVMPKSSSESGIPVLRAYDQALGQVAYSIDTAALPLYAFMLDPSPSPVIGGANSVLIGYWYVDSTYPTALSKFRLERFDTANRTSLWHVDSDAITGLPTSSINPIVATGVVYAVNPALNRVEARKESDGALLWTWTPPLDDQSPFMDGQNLLDFGSSMIATNNILFVATRRFVYGVSLTSHQNVWSHWNTGKLSMSANGVLYIKSTALFVDAINLQ